LEIILYVLLAFVIIIVLAFLIVGNMLFNLIKYSGIDLIDFVKVSGKYDEVREKLAEKFEEKIILMNYKSLNLVKDIGKICLIPENQQKEYENFFIKLTEANNSTALIMSKLSFENFKVENKDLKQKIESYKKEFVLLTLMLKRFKIFFPSHLTLRTTNHGG